MWSGLLITYFLFRTCEAVMVTTKKNASSIKFENLTSDIDSRLLGAIEIKEATMQ